MDDEGVPRVALGERHELVWTGEWIGVTVATLLDFGLHSGAAMVGHEHALIVCLN
jgi:hypothetical protein